MNDVDLDKLRIFLAVYAARGVRDGARALKVTPSAVSMALKNFEQELGEALFVRAGRSMVPTAAATRLVALTEPFLADFTAFVADLRSHAGEIRGLIRLGLPAEFGTNVVIPAMGAFRRIHPGVSFKLQFGEPSTLVPGLLAGSFEAVICDDGPYVRRYPQIASFAVAHEDLVLSCSREFSEQNLRGDFSFKRLSSCQHIAYTDNQQDLHKWYSYHFGRTTRVPIALVTDNVRGVLAAVRAGLGLGMVPRHLIEDDMVQGSINLVKTKRRSLMSAMLLMQLKERIASAAEKAFVKHLTETSKQNAARR